MSAWPVFPSPHPELAAALVVAFDSSRPDEHYEAIALDLRNRGVRGTVIFDLLLSNGAGTRRFFAFPFDGEKFDFRCIERLAVPDPKLLQETTRILKKHAREVSMLILRADQRPKVRRGEPL